MTAWLEQLAEQTLNTASSNRMTHREYAAYLEYYAVRASYLEHRGKVRGAARSIGMNYETYRMRLNKYFGGLGAPSDHLAEIAQTVVVGNQVTLGGMQVVGTI